MHQSGAAALDILFSQFQIEMINQIVVAKNSRMQKQYDDYLLKQKM